MFADQHALISGNSLRVLVHLQSDWAQLNTHAHGGVALHFMNMAALEWQVRSPAVGLKRSHCPLVCIVAHHMHKSGTLLDGIHAQHATKEVFVIPSDQSFKKRR